MTLVEQLRWASIGEYAMPTRATCSKAADAIERLEAENAKLRETVQFICQQLQMHSPKMDGSHSWRWRGGWPMSAVRAATANEAIVRAMYLVREAEQAKEE